MGRSDYKTDELRKVANIIMESRSKEEMIQKLNGFRMGLTNKHGRIKRIDIWALLIREYR